MTTFKKAAGCGLKVALFRKDWEDDEGRPTGASLSALVARDCWLDMRLNVAGEITGVEVSRKTAGGKKLKLVCDVTLNEGGEITALTIGERKVRVLTVVDVPAGEGRPVYELVLAEPLPATYIEACLAERRVGSGVVPNPVPASNGVASSAAVNGDEHIPF